jgi:hypothetical protein
MAFSTLMDTLFGAAEPLALLADAIQAGKYSGAEHRSFLLAEHRRHLDHGATHWGAAVDALLVAVQPDTRRIEFGQGIRHMEDAAPKAVDRPYHQNVIATPHRVLQHCVECLPLIATLGTTDALVLVGLDDQPATVLCHPCQDEPLILSGLVVTADPQVYRRANAVGAHSSPSELYRNDTTDPEFVKQFVRDGSQCQTAGGWQRCLAEDREPQPMLADTCPRMGRHSQ